MKSTGGLNSSSSAHIAMVATSIMLNADSVRLYLIVSIEHFPKNTPKYQNASI